jgi:hypothetical protein
MAAIIVSRAITAVSPGKGRENEIRLTGRAGGAQEAIIWLVTFATVGFFTQVVDVIYFKFVPGAM